MNKIPRTFKGVVLQWSEIITENSPQRKIRGLTLDDMKLLEKMLRKLKILGWSLKDDKN